MSPAERHALAFLRTARLAAAQRGGAVFAAVALGLVLTSVPSLASSPQGSSTFTLLSYNVQGLPKGSSPLRKRFPEIAKLAGKYDVILAQEVFGGAGKLARGMPGKHAVEGIGWAGNAGDVLLKVVAAPVPLVFRDFWPPFGSGLYTFVDDRLLRDGDPDPGKVEKAAYEECYGGFHDGSDCFARKGYLRVRIEAAEGLQVDVYNTHLDAGNDDQSRGVRWAQLRELACAIDAQGWDRPVVVAGDLNIAYGRPGDRLLIATFREHLGLADSGAGPLLPHWRERDHILYRDGARVGLTVEDSGEDQSFVPDGRALSDHPALFATFRVTPNASGHSETPEPEKRWNCAR